MAIKKKFMFDGTSMHEEIVRSKGEEKSSLAKKQNAAENRKAEDIEIKMLVSSLLKKDGRQYARVSFLRGEDIAEGIVPDGKLERVSGFSEEEAAGLRFYLAANKEAILEQAKQIDPLTNWLRAGKKSE